MVRYIGLVLNCCYSIVLSDKKYTFIYFYFYFPSRCEWLQMAANSRRLGNRGYWAELTAILFDDVPKCPSCPRSTQQTSSYKWLRWL